MSNRLTNSIPDLLLLGTGTRVGREESELEVVALPAQAIFHSVIFGKSGYGKSRFLCALALMLLSRGIPFFLIDKTGDLAGLLLQLLISLEWFSQADAFSQLVFLDLNKARQKGLYLPFNVLQTSHDPYTTADMVFEAFTRSFPSLKGGTMINIELLLKVCAYVLAANTLPLFPYMYYLLADTPYRSRLLASPAVKDSLIKNFFEQHTHPKTGELTISADPTIKRLFILCFAPVIRYSLGQSRNVLDFPAFFANGTSVILNLQSPDPETIRLIGSLVTVSVELAAKARGDIPAAQRKGTHALIIDEFQQFVSSSGESFNNILDECRKYGLYLVLASQSYKRVPDSIKQALFNTDIRAAFRLEEPDADAVAPLLHFPYDPSFSSRAAQHGHDIGQITKLPKRKAFVKLPNDALYRMETLSVNDPVIDPIFQEQIEDEYLRRYFVSQVDVEKEIAANLQHTVIKTPLKTYSATIPPTYAALTNDILSQGENDDEDDELDEFRSW